MKRLIQTQNPEVVKQILPFWRKYLGKIKYSLDEAELNRFAACFIPGSSYRLFVLFDEKEKKICGFCTMYLDENYGALILLQEATEDREAMKEELIYLAGKIGAIAVYFSTERNEKAWERLVGTKKIASILELPMEKVNKEKKEE